MVEVPPLELEPDFDTGGTDPGHEVDDQPLAMDDARGGGRGGRRSGAIDFNLDGVVTQGGRTRIARIRQHDTTPTKPTIEELEGRVADDPDDPGGHQALGEALIEAGERERGVEELDLATTGFETRGTCRRRRIWWTRSLRLDPNSVRHRQKQVEFRVQVGRQGEADRRLRRAGRHAAAEATSPTRRGLSTSVSPSTIQPTSGAKAALAMLAPVATPPPEPPAKPKAKLRDTEGKTAARDAKLKVRDEGGGGGDFVDLSAMIPRGGPPVRDTRMKVADEEPTGDEERDFQEMLARFQARDRRKHRRGRLPVALTTWAWPSRRWACWNEAIAELQKALRAPDGKLRSSEALGVCFFDRAPTSWRSRSCGARSTCRPPGPERWASCTVLGRALESWASGSGAREMYGRVFRSWTFRFRDVAERSKALAKAK